MVNLWRVTETWGETTPNRTYSIPNDTYLFSLSTNCSYKLMQPFLDFVKPPVPYLINSLHLKFSNTILHPNQRWIVQLMVNVAQMVDLSVQKGFKLRKCRAQPTCDRKKEVVWFLACTFTFI